MTKKNWINPELNELGVALTKDDTTVSCPEETIDELFFGQKSRCVLPGCNHEAARNSDKCKCHQNTEIVRPYPTETVPQS